MPAAEPLRSAHTSLLTEEHMGALRLLMTAAMAVLEEAHVGQTEVEEMQLMEVEEVVAWVLLEILPTTFSMVDAGVLVELTEVEAVEDRLELCRLMATAEK